jgi:pimeloyl-ACP methyl ester carboxylesterase
MIPETRYTKSGDIHIAYQVVGDGTRDLVLVPGWISNIDVFWEEPSMVRFLKKLASFSRLILFDKRGTGLSDRVTDTPMLEERMEDVRAVLDAVGSKRATLLGYSEAGTMVALFAATYPERTSAIIMISSFARRIKTVDYPWGATEAQYQSFIDDIQCNWGGPVGMEIRVPSRINDLQFKKWWAKFLRMGASPATAAAITRMNIDIDVRDILPLIKVPTLIIHARGDQAIELGHGEYLAENIPNSTFVVVDTSDHLPWVGAATEILEAVEEFVTGIKTHSSTQRVLSTLMFTDIVDSTRIAQSLGDKKWRDLLENHDTIVRHELSIYRGKEIDTAGDSFFASFDGPARALRCAQAVIQSLLVSGVSVRIGIHTGECELRGNTLAGIAVHITSRIADLAGPQQILVSRTVKDLVAGSGIEFADIGSYSLKGVSEDWQIFEVIH